MAAGLAVAAAALAAAPARGGEEGHRAGSDRERNHSAQTATELTTPSEADISHPTVSAPVRIPDAETVRLLRPGDRVDVIAAKPAAGPASSAAHFVARNVRVAQLPRSGETMAGDGALVVLAVSRSTAAELADAAATSRLAVTLC